jgi:hypothetical protein
MQKAGLNVFVYAWEAFGQKYAENVIARKHS